MQAGIEEDVLVTITGLEEYNYKLRANLVGLLAIGCFSMYVTFCAVLYELRRCPVACPKVIDSYTFTSYTYMVVSPNINLRSYFKNFS